ncbi:MAG: hypothetical protein AMJ60_01160 [Desulfobacterales bacterium SG8_35]|nr:MAG: hypothetical protein AMJ60_01160 [Desulfobacterales bacterium SG8_35]
MIKRFFYHFPGAVIACFLLVLPAGCSKNEDQHVEEKSRTEKMTDQAAEAAVKKIRTPMDKARATQNLGNDRLEEMDRAVQKQ